MQQDPGKAADNDDKDSANEMQQIEKLIDPGNEHAHDQQSEDKIPGQKGPEKKDTDAVEKEQSS